MYSLAHRKISENMTISYTDEKHHKDPSVTEYEDEIQLGTVLSESGQEFEIHGNLKEMDQALELAMNNDDFIFTEEEDTKLLRKIDLVLMPFVSFLYSLFYIDKASNGWAAVMGIRKDMNMKGIMYSWTGSAFYLGYLVYQPLASLSLQKFPLVTCFSVYMFSWAVIICLQATNHSYPAFTFLRTLLGCSEASASVFTTLLTSQYYRKKEAFLRVSFWLATSGFGVFFGNMMAYGIAIRSESFSIAAWKVLFIVIGLISFVVAVILHFHVPNTPATAWFLNEREKRIVVERIRENYQGFGTKVWKKHQFFEAVLDIKTWVFFIYAVAFNIPNSALASFGSILLSTDFGYSSTDALLYGAPQGVVEFLCLPAIAYAIQKFNLPRLLSTAVVITICITFACMLAFGKNSGTKLAGYYLLYLMQIGPIGSFSYFASNVPGYTKKITVTSVYLVGYCVGSLVGPQTFATKDAPHYTPAKIAIVVCICVAAGCFYTLWLICYMENKARDKKAIDLGDKYCAPKNIEFSDLTSTENIYFRYTL